MSRRIASFLRFLVVTVIAAMSLSLAVAAPAGAAGEDWQSLNSGLTSSGTITGLFFIDELEGWAVVGDDGTPAVVRTTDGGVIWTPQTIAGLSANAYSVYFANSTTGWLVGDGGMILKTTDGGDSWTTQSSTVAADLRGISFIDENTGWVGCSTGNVIKTVNGGATWEEQVTGNTNFLVDVDFVDTNVGWAVGKTHTIIKTTNGGTSWESQDNPAPSWLFNGSFYDANKGWVCGSTSTILYTENGGDDWSLQTLPPTTGTVRCIQFLDDGLTGWGVGQSGEIIHTTDGGANWSVQTSDTIEYLRWVYMHDADLGWAAGEGNTILIKGESPVPPPPTAAFSADVTSVEVGDTITFTNTSTGDPTSWSWDFDNDGTADSQLQNPTHSYSTAGTYTVKLTATNTGGSDSETKAAYIFVAEEGSLVLPGVATEIDSSDGGVKIDFAAGSVEERSEVSIEEITEVPAAPAGYTLGTSLYDINLTDDAGADVDMPLAQAVTITFDYSTIDAANAGGADNLTIAYYDEAAEQWQVLTTTVDTTARTLSAGTTHLSKWAVIYAGEDLDTTGGGCCASAAATASEIASGWGLIGMLGIVGCYLIRRNGRKK